jgi:hypothetical protein
MEREADECTDQPLSETCYVISTSLGIPMPMPDFSCPIETDAEPPVLPKLDMILQHHRLVPIPASISDLYFATAFAVYRYGIWL